MGIQLLGIRVLGIQLLGIRVLGIQLLGIRVLGIRLPYRIFYLLIDPARYLL